MNRCNINAESFREVSAIQTFFGGFWTDLCRSRDQFWQTCVHFCSHFTIITIFRADFKKKCLISGLVYDWMTQADRHCNLFHSVDFKRQALPWFTVYVTLIVVRMMRSQCSHTLILEWFHVSSQNDLVKTRFQILATSPSLIKKCSFLWNAC